MAKNLADHRLWIVIQPTRDSILDDILFHTTFRGLLLQGAGGLKGEDVRGIYMGPEKDRATKHAQRLLASSTNAWIEKLEAAKLETA